MNKRRKRIPLCDQRLGVRLFKDAASTKERYRITWARGCGGYIVYHNGNRILDTRAMRRGTENPGVLIDEIKRIRKW